MRSRPAARLVGVLLIAGAMGACGRDAEGAASRRVAQRLAARDASVVGTWTIDADRMRDAFRRHLGVEVELYSRTADEMQVSEMAERQVRHFERVLGSFDGSVLTVSADRSFHFHDGFAWGHGSKRGTWNVRSRRLILTVTWDPGGDVSGCPVWVDLDGDSLRLTSNHGIVWDTCHRSLGDEETGSSPVYFRPDEVHLRRSTEG